MVALGDKRLAGRRGRGRLAPAAAALLAVAGVGAGLVGLGAVLADAGADARYRSLAETVWEAGAGGRKAQEDEGGGEVGAWDDIAMMAPAAVAWVRIEGTGVDHPVTQATDDAPDWYLTHDVWGATSDAGCPYIDARASTSDRHVLVYGHRMSTTGGIFSDLSDAHRQAAFDNLGTMRWHERTGASCTLVPLLAMEVDEWYRPIQSFDHRSNERLRAWLLELVRDADARHPEAEGLAGRAARAVTLVTCSSAMGGMPGRCVVVFVSDEGR